jgi:hypothetical protein
MDSGYGDEESYNVYDKPWRESGNLGAHIYRPSRNLDKDVYGDDLDKLIKTNRYSSCYFTMGTCKLLGTYHVHLYMCVSSHVFCYTVGGESSSYFQVVTLIFVIIIHRK